MHYNILMPIDAPTARRVERICNSYLYQLRSLEQVVAPSLSMATYAALVAADETANTQHVAEMSSMLRGLFVLASSLHGLADCLTEAYLDLEEFIAEGSNFQHFAAQRRMEDAKQHGYTDDADVTPDGRSFVLRTEPEALAPFQLRVVLAKYFPSPTAQGERIGSSSIEAYTYYTGLVANEVVFALRDPTQPATPANLTTYQRAEAAALGMREEEQPDERFRECDTSLRGPKLIAEFSALLGQCQEAAALYLTLAEDDTENNVAGYSQLFKLLAQIVDGDGQE